MVISKERENNDTSVKKKKKKTETLRDEEFLSGLKRSTCIFFGPLERGHRDASLCQRSFTRRFLYIQGLATNCEHDDNASNSGCN